MYVHRIPARNLAVCRAAALIAAVAAAELLLYHVSVPLTSSCACEVYIHPNFSSSRNNCTLAALSLSAPFVSIVPCRHNPYDGLWALMTTESNRREEQADDATTIPLADEALCFLLLADPYESETRETLSFSYPLFTWCLSFYNRRNGGPAALPINRGCRSLQL